MAEKAPLAYGVVGNPIHHSLSPQIHRQFAIQCGIPMTYAAFLINSADFHTFTTQFFHRGGRGLNITVPFKEFAHEFVGEKTLRAQQAGAVNTIIWRPTGLLGDNTDGVGFIRDLTIHYQLDLNNMRVLMVGAGGAAKGLVVPLFESGIQSLFLTNRTRSRAEQLARQFKKWGKIQVVDIDSSVDREFDLIINATAASLHDDSLALPWGICSENTVLYDLVYGKTTPFMAWGQRNRARLVCDGLGMLVEQAAAAFAEWHEVWPKTEPILLSLRSLQTDG